MESPAKGSNQVLVNGDHASSDVLEELFPTVYDELRRAARRYLSTERKHHTLQPTALVHEAYLRLFNQRAVPFQNPAHFFAIAAQMMRRILVNHARDRQRLKRGGTSTRVTLDKAVDKASERSVDLVELDQALAKLATRDQELSRIVELRYFAGLTIAEAADVLGVSPATVKNKWSMARAWLHRELRLGGQDGN
jgi:RNA polymerase sigma factor (TIGR02999 family)